MTIVAAVDQRCYYDIHCAENAYCHDQQTCKCKPETPVLGDDGFSCSGADVVKSSGIVFTVLVSFYKLYIWILVL